MGGREDRVSVRSLEICVRDVDGGEVQVYVRNLEICVHQHVADSLQMATLNVVHRKDSPVTLSADHHQMYLLQIISNHLVRFLTKLRISQSW